MSTEPPAHSDQSPSSADVTEVTAHLPAANVVFTPVPGAKGFHFPPLPPAHTAAASDPATPAHTAAPGAPTTSGDPVTPANPTAPAPPAGPAPTATSPTRDISDISPPSDSETTSSASRDSRVPLVPAPRSAAEGPVSFGEGPMPSIDGAALPAEPAVPPAAPGTTPPASAPEGVPVSPAPIGTALHPDDLPSGEALGAEISAELAAQTQPAPHPAPTGEWRGIVLVTGTDTDVGKTVVTAAIAAAAQAAGLRVAVIKPGQTGTLTGAPTDIEVINRLAGPDTSRTLAEYPEPMAPLAAATVASMPPLEFSEVVDAVRAEADKHDLVLVEGAGGLLVPMGVRPSGESWTVADLATALGVRTIVVARAGLGTLNHTALTLEALSRRGVPAGVVIGAWPADPELVHWANFSELAPHLVGALPAGAGRMDPGVFRRSAPGWLTPALYGVLDNWRVWAEETGEGHH